MTSVESGSNSSAGTLSIETNSGSSSSNSPRSISACLPRIRSRWSDQSWIRAKARASRPSGCRLRASGARLRAPTLGRWSNLEPPCRSSEIQRKCLASILTRGSASSLAMLAWSVWLIAGIRPRCLIESRRVLNNPENYSSNGCQFCWL